MQNGSRIFSVLERRNVKCRGRRKWNRLLTPKVGHLGNLAVCHGPRINDLLFNGLKLILNHLRSYPASSPLRCPVPWELCEDISAEEFLLARPTSSVLATHTSLVNHYTKRALVLLAWLISPNSKPFRPLFQLVLYFS